MIARVLGPLQATLNGVSVVPTAPMARRVLALLVLDHGRVVRLGTLEDELWGPTPPRSASTGVQNSVMQIRRAMDRALREQPGGPSGKELLTTEPTGYRLGLTGHHFDVDQYRDGIAGAERAEAAGELVLALSATRAALALWSDTPLSDLPVGPVLQSHVLRLEEERKAGLRRRISLELRLRRHGEIIGELRQLTEREPYDETLHEFLMFALHFSGRRNEALSTYQGFRSALAESVGLEPSSRLRSLQQAILLAEDSLEDSLLDPSLIGAGPTTRW